MNSGDLLTVSEVAYRSGFAPSAIRFYDKQGLITRRGQPEGSGGSSETCCDASHSSVPRATSA